MGSTNVVRRLAVLDKRFNELTDLFQFFRRFMDVGMSFSDCRQVSCIGTMCRIVGVITLTLVPLFAFGPDIRRFVQFGTMTGFVNITDFEATDVVGTSGTTIAIATVKTGVVANIVSFAGVFGSVVIFTGKGNSVNKVAVTLNFPCDGRRRALQLSDNGGEGKALANHPFNNTFL